MGKCNQLQDQFKFFKIIFNETMKPRAANPSLNPHMHKMGPWGAKNYIFGNHFYSKNGRKLRFHVFLHFTARKHMISAFYLKWT